MKVRAGRPQDLPELERLKRAMGYPGSVFLDESSYFEAALQRLRESLPRLEELPEWRVLVLVEEEKPTGYLVMVLDDEHGVTHQLQTLILDYAVFSFEALSKLVTRARKIVVAFENEYLVAELAAADQRRQLWFYRCGFRPEQNRSAFRFARGHRGASTPEFAIRPAYQEDLPFILEVHSAYTPAYLPAGRDTDLETVEFRYQLTYAAFDLTRPAEKRFFILEEVASQRAAGYLIVQDGPIFNGCPSLYIYDVAVAPAFAGRGLSLYLVGHAETLAGQAGAILYGDASLRTPLLAGWHAQMGYVVDTIRFGLDCRPDVKTL